MVKVLLDGEHKSGKTSFHECAMKDSPVSLNPFILPPIGIDFAVKQFNIGQETKLKLELWDSYSGERVLHIPFTFYRATSTILLLGNPYSSNVKHVFDYKKEEFRTHAINPEVILLTTKSDLENSSAERSLCI
ncbi:predicted protein [Naegleria gruberi]|uniref:Predicted protein n=1 Tax=Naegleria gruberi TaxID=5762 RepID=D2VW03_NAEGR|nr:uncharacterized protein NAEGRDRAFT_73202 [Naegleria gruberi]EFC38993.1 predicted protein [Naegleria gruberi]|eukprot:XP_002671737.1 predicted protein [Naegleria gruberi strain NEG-M]